MIVDFSKMDTKERPLLLLKNLDGTILQSLGYAFDITGDFSYNEVSVLQFSVPAYVGFTAVPHYDSIVGMQIVDLVGCGQFLLIDPQEENDGTRKIKVCKAYSLEYEFAKKEIFLEGGTYNFWNPLMPDDTIIGRILEKMPDWKIGTIDSTLIGKYRTFEDVQEKLYDFMKSNLQETYGCIFEFDTYNRLISVRNVESVIPVSSIYLSTGQLVKEIDIEENSDEIVTCLDVNGAEGVSIRSVNPTGTNQIYNLDYFMTEDRFSADLIAKWRGWQEGLAAARESYYSMTLQYHLLVSKNTTGNAELATLQGERLVLENQRAVTVQAIAQGLQEQSALDAVNRDLRAKEAEISAKEAEIAGTTAEMEQLHAQMAQVNNRWKLERYFTAAELSSLRKYFFEDTLQDSSFVASTVESYTVAGKNTVCENLAFVFRNGTIQDLGNDTLLLQSGTCTAGNFTGELVRGVIQIFSDGSIVFSGYFGRGTENGTVFESGCVSLSGQCSNITRSGTTFRFTVLKGMFCFTRDASEMERRTVEWDLYEYGQQVLRDKSMPWYHFSVECGNFLALSDFDLFRRELTLGRRVYLQIDEKEPISPYVVAVHVNFEDPEDFSLEFSSNYTAMDRSFRLSQLLEQSVSMGKKLSSKGGMYSEFVSSGASTRVKEYMESSFDFAKNTILSSGDQAWLLDDAGLRLRKWRDGNKVDYEDMQIWLVNNMIAFTTDNWNTSNLAIGQFYDEETGWHSGVNADVIAGHLLAGENLIIESAKQDGGVSVFRVDGNGASLYNARFELKKEKAHMVLDPEIGFGLGTYPIVSSGAWDDDNTKFWVDTDGNVHMKGTLEGADGTFSGSLSAATGTFSGDISAATGNFSGSLSGANITGATGTFSGSISVGDNFKVDASGNMTAKSGTFSGSLDGATGSFSGSLNAATGTFSGKLSAASGSFSGVVDAEEFKIKGSDALTSNDKIGADFLELKGLIIRDSSNKITFQIDSNGNVTINGDITMSSGSSISWSDITDADSHLYNYLDTTLSDVAFTGRYDSLSGLPDIPVYPKYIKSTYIDNARIETPRLISPNIYTDSLSIYGDFDNNPSEWLRIYFYDSGASPNIVFNSSGIGEFDFSMVRVSSNYLETHNVRPNTDLSYTLGESNMRWNDIYGRNSVIKTSDRVEKKDIEYNIEKYEDFFMQLKPTQYKFKNNNSNRYHVGFISQDVEEALTNTGLSSLDFAGFIKSPNTEGEISDSAGEEEKREYIYGLRYGEFIALNTHMIQRLYREVQALKEFLQQQQEEQ